jgi:hypothetical protein
MELPPQFSSESAGDEFGDTNAAAHALSNLNRSLNPFHGPAGYPASEAVAHPGQDAPGSRTSGHNYPDRCRQILFPTDLISELGG